MTAFVFAFGVVVGLAISFSRSPAVVRYDHFELKTRLVLIRTTKRSQRIVTVQWDGEAWPRTQEELVGLMLDGRLTLAELHGAQRGVEYLESR